MALILDGTTGIDISEGTKPISPGAASALLQEMIPAGTKMMFVQSAAPTGWTKDITHDNKALRVVSGTAGSGGTVAFTNAFSSGLSSGSTTLTTDQIPSHTHRAGGGQNGDFTGLVGGGQGGWGIANASTNNNIYRGFNDNTGGSNSHNHTIPNFEVSYVDTIIATKN